MASDSPASVLVDENGNLVGVVLDGSVYRVQTEAKLATGHGLATQATLATLATEAKLEAVRALVASIDAKDFATETTQATLATEAKLEAVRVILASIDAKDFATETTSAAIQAVLAAIRDTAGVKKITDALPAGDNLVGRVKVSDGTNVAGVVVDGAINRLRTESKLRGLVSTANSSTTPLGIGATFTGTAEDVTDYAIAYVTVRSDVASATDGLSVEQSSDGTNWDLVDIFTVQANSGKTFSFQCAGKFFRVRYTNGGTGQASFRLQTVYKQVYGKPSSHRISDEITNDDDAELVKSVLAGENGSGTFKNVAVDGEGNLQVLAAISISSAFLLVNLTYEQSIGAIVANKYRRVLSYTIPAGFKGTLTRYMSFQDEAATSRFVSTLSVGTLSIVTDTYTPGSAFVFPQFAAIVTMEVTTALSSGSGNVTVTVTYTNQTGTSGRTGTVDIAKGAAVGSRWPITLQAGDIGVQSIQNLSVSPTLAAGAIQALGLIQAVLHQDRSSTVALETVLSPGAVTFPPLTELAFEFAGGTVSKLRNFDALIQLAPA